MPPHLLFSTPHQVQHLWPSIGIFNAISHADHCIYTPRFLQNAKSNDSALVKYTPSIIMLYAISMTALLLSSPEIPSAIFGIWEKAYPQLRTTFIYVLMKVSLMPVTGAVMNSVGAMVVL